jgi:tripartite-type tricarboxylate transporter receptor subunit TctC
VRTRLWLLWGMVMASAVPQAAAQTYPARPVRVIAGFPPGSAVDIVSRIVAQRLSEATAQQFVVDNRPGAGSNIAAELAARAAPDGYTLFMSTIANSINASLYPKLSFDFGRDFAPIALVASVPTLLCVHPSLPARDVKQLIAAARSRPGQILYASSGIGTAPHVAAELFNSLAHVKLTHVPYKGSPQAVTDLLAGQVAVMFAPASTVLPHVKSGRLRALATSGTARTRHAPDLPTVAEAGLPGFEVTLWFGLMGPAGVAAEIVGRLNAETVKALANPAVVDQLGSQGMDTLGGTPQEFAAYVRSEIQKWARVVRETGARAE